jgi:hypothetical protein
MDGKRAGYINLPTSLASSDSAVCLLLILLFAIAAIAASTAGPPVPATLELKGQEIVKIVFF